MTDTGKERVFCPVCQARFPLDDGLKAGDEVLCPICGQRLLLKQGPDGLVGDRVNRFDEAEIRDRSENFARMRGYEFGDVKEEIIQGLLGKQKRFGDFYCPCRMNHTPEYQCPCRPTRGGDVQKNGRCYCGFFVKAP